MLERGIIEHKLYEGGNGMGWALGRRSGEGGRSIQKRKGEEGQTTLRMFEKDITNNILYLPEVIKNTYKCLCVLNKVMLFGLTLLPPMTIDYLTRTPIPGMRNLIVV